ncbi:hypothetical protein [Aeromonas sp.]|nr:hypothetical protein [Aeromonas sp.]MCX7131905.1 hypothetical protein [Aeromonas sp.]
MSEQAVLVGGWTAYHKLTAEDQAVFDQALKGFVGVQYVPFEVCTQVVAGTNYRFKCKSTVPLAKPIHGEAVVQIFPPSPRSDLVAGQGGEGERSQAVGPNNQQ